jgi:holo-[acyl-carrier protein] synthase
MIKGLGVDIIEIDRVRSAVDRYGDRFLRKILTPREIKYCRNRKSFRFPEMAARFAAKEAYSKAIGTGITGIRWQEIEVVNNERGKPHIAVKGKIKKKVHVSLSHSLNYAVASVVIEQ